MIAPFALLQAADPAPVQPSSAPTVQVEPNPEVTRVNMHFVDTDLKEIVSFLRDTFQGANFMLQPKAESIRVTLNVRNVGLEQALQAVAFASEGRVAVDHMDYHFYGLVLTDSTGTAAQKPTSHVFNLSGAQDFSDTNADTFLDELKNSIGQTVAALHTVDPAATVEMPELQFHRATRLLVAVGKPDSLAIVEQFVAALGGRGAEMSLPTKNPTPGATGAHGGLGQPGSSGAAGVTGGAFGPSGTSGSNGASGLPVKSGNNRFSLPIPPVPQSLP